MVTGEHRARSVRAPVVLVGLAVFLSGCALRAPVAPATAAIPAPAAAIEPAPVDARPGADAAAPVVVAILFSGSMPGQAAIAAHIGDGLARPAYAARPIDIDALGEATPIDAAFEAGVGIVAAIGPDALTVARQRFGNAEIVFSQVLEPDQASGAARGIRGVAPMPPPALQLRAWAEVDPGLARIGLITSERLADTVRLAREAAAAIGAELVHRFSTSDRETLYLFRRLAPTIDGLWLAPDSEILSTAVIDDMLAHSAELEIGVLVFSESLLDRGGLISVGASAGHVAGTVVAAIDAIRAGRATALPAEIALTEASVRVNARIVADLGLPATPTEWVIRDGR